MLNRRYQVYICCTQQDLETECEALALALLRLRCIPACRQFLADDAPWSEVRAEINSSDYVLVLSATRYGELLDNGISRAHRDYTYACSRGKPVFALLSDPELQRTPAQQESSAEGRARLLAFRRQLRRHKGIVWGGVEALTRQTRSELPAFMRENSAPGWRRSSQAQALAALTRTPPKLPEPAGAEPARSTVIEELAPIKQKLEQRQDLSFRCNLFVAGNCHLIQQRASIPLNELFLGYASALQEGTCSEDRIQLALSSLLEQRYRRLILERHPEAHAVDEFNLLEDARDTLHSIFHRLELIGKVTQPAHRKRVVWSLTSQGHALSAELKKAASQNR